MKNSLRIRKDLEDPDERGDPWLFQENPWLVNVYNTLIERRNTRQGPRPCRKDQYDEKMRYYEKR